MLLFIVLEESVLQMWLRNAIGCAGWAGGDVGGKGRRSVSMDAGSVAVSARTKAGKFVIVVVYSSVIHL